MKPVLISLIIVFICASACKKDSAPTLQVNYLKARVTQTADIDCHIPVLDFSEDSSAIRILTNRNYIVYSVISMPSSLIVQNKRLYVAVRTLMPEEEFPCTTLGIGYPHLKILDAKER